ncbi:B-cell lymphoma 3 protein [Phlyctochytrium bullatum]|nr:B-cell lymphoma 3 protein [Phlyctochytrium bullatum]
MIGLPSFPTELLRMVLLDLHPNDLVALAAVNRHLRRAIPACIDSALAKRHIILVSNSKSEQKEVVSFDHPVLFEHAVAAEDWMPFGRLWGEAIRLNRVRVARTAVQRRVWPCENYHDEFDQPEIAFELAGFLKSLELLEDLRNTFPDSNTDNVYSGLMEMFFIASAKRGFCKSLDLIPPMHPILKDILYDKKTLLDLAIVSDHARDVKLLLAKGAAVNPVPSDVQAKPPLFYALENRDTKILRILLEHGADVKIAFQGTFPLHRAVSYMLYSPKAVKLLLEFGADVDAYSDWGGTALSVAAMMGLYKGVQVLLDAGAEVDAVGEDHKTAALSIYRLNTALLLLDAGADPTIKCNDGVTPLQLFPTDVPFPTEWEELLDRLIEKGAKLHETDRSGRTAWQNLGVAALIRKDPELLKWVLLREGLDVAVADNGAKIVISFLQGRMRDTTSYPNDLVALAAVNRHLRRRIPACIDSELAKRQIDGLKHLYACERSRRQKRTKYWTDLPWRPFVILGKEEKEAIRLNRARVVRTAVQRRVWPNEDTLDVFDQPDVAFELAGFLKSLDLLKDLLNAFPEEDTNADYMDSDSMLTFFIASAKTCFCEGLDLIPPVPPILERIDDDYNTLLATAITSQHVSAVELLLRKGAAVNAAKTNNNYTPPLFCALQQENVDLQILRLLLQHGADVSRRYQGKIPLHRYLAGRKRSPEVLKLLLDFCTDIEARNKQGFTALSVANSKTPEAPAAPPLFYALEHRDLKILRLLLQHGASVERRFAGHLPLHQAAMKGSPEALKLLLEFGADIEARTEKGCTPLGVAVSMGRCDRVRALLEAGASVDAVGSLNARKSG